MILSCNLWLWPCQNSTLSSWILNPPQWGGLGISFPSKLSSTSLAACSRALRLSTGLLYLLAYELILFSRFLLAQYASLSSSEVCVTFPSMRICLSSWSQWKLAHALGLAFRASPFRLSRLVKKTTPLLSCPLQRTSLTLGYPEASTVATLIAFGLGTVVTSLAASNQILKASIGSENGLSKLRALGECTIGGNLIPVVFYLTAWVVTYLEIRFNLLAVYARARVTAPPTRAETTFSFVNLSIY